MSISRNKESGFFEDLINPRDPSSSQDIAAPTTWDLRPRRLEQRNPGPSMDLASARDFRQAPVAHLPHRKMVIEVMGRNQSGSAEREAQDGGHR